MTLLMDMEGVADDEESSDNRYPQYDANSHCPELHVLGLRSPGPMLLLSGKLGIICQRSTWHPRPMVLAWISM
jgi:hypothetical protein